MFAFDPFVIFLSVIDVFFAGKYILQLKFWNEYFNLNNFKKN